MKLNALPLSFLALLAGCGGKEILYKERPLGYWAARLRDRDESTRMDALHAFKDLGPEAHSEVATMIEALAEESNNQVRSTIAEALGDIGPKARSAAPVLIKLVKAREENIDVRDRAATALGQMGAKEVVPILISRLDDEKEEARVRSSSALALGSIGPDARAAVPHLVEALKSEDLRGAAVCALGDLGPLSREALPALKALNDQDKWIRQWISEALERIEGSGAGNP